MLKVVHEQLLKVLSINKTPQNTVDLTTDSDKENSTEPINKKRKAADELPASKPKSAKAEMSFKDRYKHCVNCYELFDVLKPEGECRYHPDELEIDDEADFFADHDEDPNDDWHRLEYPEGFIWNCCEQAGNIKGCQTGVHEAGSDSDFSEHAKLIRQGFKDKASRYAGVIGTRY